MKLIYLCVFIITNKLKIIYVKMESVSLFHMSDLFHYYIIPYYIIFIVIDILINSIYRHYQLNDYGRNVELYI